MKTRIQNLEYRIQNVERVDDTVGARGWAADPDNGELAAKERIELKKAEIASNAGIAATGFYRLSLGFCRILGGFYRLATGSYRIIGRGYRLLPLITASYRITFFLAAKRSLEPRWGQENHGDTKAQPRKKSLGRSGIRPYRALGGAETERSLMFA